MNKQKGGVADEKMSCANIAPGIFILPKTAQRKLPHYAICVFNIIVNKFPKTYITGGAVRNILLNKKVSDVDLATSAKPIQVLKLLKADKISCSARYSQFGIIVAETQNQTLEIATFRKDVYGQSRFPKVSFINSPKQDSARRDFTINALYYSLEANAVLDFHDGIEDLAKRRLRFIGNTKKRILEDPLRIVRAYRFALQYKLSIDKQTETTLQAHKHLLKTISKTRLQKEISALQPKKLQKTLQKVIHSNTWRMCA